MSLSARHAGQASVPAALAARPPATKIDAPTCARETPAKPRLLICAAGQVNHSYLAMSVSPESHVARVEAALSSPDRFAAAYAVAVDLRDGGMPQDELLGIFDVVRSRHPDDSPEQDAVLDVMDLITGWCSPSRALYPEAR